MSFNLLDAAKNWLPNDLISKAASSLGENEESIQKALAGAIPSIFSGLLSPSSSSGSGGSSGILDLVKGVAGSNVLSNITGLFDSGGSSHGISDGIGATILGWLKSLFGDKLNSIISTIASFAGIKTSSASSVLSMATPAVLAPVSQYATDNNLNASGLTSFLHTQKSSILGALPSGFNLAGALGLGSLTDIGHKISDTVSAAKHYTEEAAEKTTEVKWLWPLLLLVALAALVWFLTQKGCNGGDTKPVSNDTTEVTTPAMNNEATPVLGKLDTLTNEFVYDLGDTISIDLPNNAGTLRVGKYSTEAKLFEFLNNPGKMIDTVKGNWFDFTNVRFKTGGSVITESSYTQLKNLVTIIKAFPVAQFKIGGYTDNTGDSVKNVSLSQKRAESVAAQVVTFGADKKQIVGAEGYGSAHPVGDNNTAEGRAMNRRVSVRVKAK